MNQNHLNYSDYNELGKQVKAAAIRYLLDGGEREAAFLLQSCDIELSDVYANSFIDSHIGIEVALLGNRKVYDAVIDADATDPDPVGISIRNALIAALPGFNRLRVQVVSSRVAGKGSISQRLKLIDEIGRKL